MNLLNFLSRWWGRRWLRVLVWLFAGTGTLLVLVHQFSNWRGARLWQTAQEEVTVAGETLDFRAVAEAAVPAEKNFGALPVFQNLAADGDTPQGRMGEKTRQRLEAIIGMSSQTPSRPNIARGILEGRPTDLQAWAEWMRALPPQGHGTPAMPQTGNAAKDLLVALGAGDALVQEMAAGLDLPEAQWTPAWREKELPGMLVAIPLPHYQVLQRLGQWLGLRAIVAARAGEPDKAHESLRLLVKMTQATQREPLLIGTLIAMSQLQITAAAVWEVCEARAGTGADFRRLEQELAKLDPAASLLIGLRGELAAGADTIMWMKARADLPSLNQMLGGSGGEDAMWWVRMMPRGWYDANAATVVSWELHHLILPLRDQGLVACMSQQAALDKKLREARPRFLLEPGTIMAQLMVPAVGKVAARAVYTEVLLQQMRAACALETYYLHGGNYPATLTELKDLAGNPLTFRPDPFTGETLHYEPQAGGRYRLWSVGFDRKNDGGTLPQAGGKQETSSKRADPSYRGDWVWHYADMTAPVRVP